MKKQETTPDTLSALLQNTTSTEVFRLAVTAKDPALLAQYKELLSVQLEAEKKAYEYQLKDMDYAEAERLRKMTEGADKKRQFSADNTL